MGAEAMNLHVLHAVCWMIGIRGHVPPDGDFPAGPNEPSLGTNTNRLMRILAAVVLAIALLSLVFWAAVWLSLK
jgi:hypothetical protein